MADIGTSILKKVDTFKTIYSNKTFDYMASKKPILMADFRQRSKQLFGNANHIFLLFFIAKSQNMARAQRIVGSKTQPY